MSDQSINVSSEVYKLENGSGTLVRDTDFTFKDNILTIKKSYLSYYFTKFPEQNLHLNVLFENGDASDLTFYIGKTFDTLIYPDNVYFCPENIDRDVRFKTYLRGNYISSIKNGNRKLVPRIDYTYSPTSKEIIIRSGYILYTNPEYGRIINSQSLLGYSYTNPPSLDTISLAVNFTGGDSQYIDIPSRWNEVYRQVDWFPDPDMHPPQTPPEID